MRKRHRTKSASPLAEVGTIASYFIVMAILVGIVVFSTKSGGSIEVEAANSATKPQASAPQLPGGQEQGAGQPKDIGEPVSPLTNPDGSPVTENPEGVTTEPLGGIGGGGGFGDATPDQQPGTPARQPGGLGSPNPQPAKKPVTKPQPKLPAMPKFPELGKGVKKPVTKPRPVTKPNPVKPNPVKPNPVKPRPVVTPKPNTKPQPIRRPTNPVLDVKPMPGVVVQPAKPITNPWPSGNRPGTQPMPNPGTNKPGLRPQPNPGVKPNPVKPNPVKPNPVKPNPVQPNPGTNPNPGSAPAWLNELNRIRAEKGLNPVTEDPALSRECVNHVAYMKIHGMKGHFETPGKQGYSKAGHKCAKESNLVSGARNELDSFRIWVGSPAHYAGMVRPGLKTVGFAYGNGYGALNVIAGLRM